MCLQATRMKKLILLKTKNSNDEKEMYRTTLNQNWDILERKQPNDEKGM